MKKFLLVFLMVSALFFAVSCSEDDISDVLGGSCDSEGMETCSHDGAQILICSDSTWQIKKACNLNFGQYCRQTASGSYSCTDSGNGGGNSDGGDTDTLPEPDDNDSTDSESSDTEPTGDTDPTDSEPADDSDSTDDGDTQPSDNDTDTDTQEPEEDPLPAPGDCANIMACFDTCEVDSEGNLIDSTCPQTCYNNGTTTGQTQYAAWQTCNENNSCKGYYDCLWEKCRDEDAVCGLAGDTANYKIPYGKANISGTFTYLHTSDEINNNEIYTNHIIEGGFVTGTFGKTKANIAGNDSYALAIFFPEETEEGETYPQYISLFQTENSSTPTLPTIQMILQAPTTGSYTFGLGAIKDEKVRMLVRNWDDSSQTYTCDHAFGYGTVTISDISYELGETKISLSGQIDLYSYKAMPYYGGDISDSQYFIACEPK